MSNEKRRRLHVQHPLQPFAGLQSQDDDTHAVNLAIYGVAATLYPIEQSPDDEDGAELVPLPGSSEPPVLVDRFDCRLLLDPLDLISRPSRRTDNDANTALVAFQLESELDEERWRDLRILERATGGYPNAIEHSMDEGNKGDLRYGEIAFGYDYGETYTQPHWVGVEPPPPPPLPKQITSARESDREQGNFAVDKGASLLSILDNQVPFTPAQFNIMHRCAEFIKKTGEKGAELLRQQADYDYTFAFIFPNHIWHEFFLGLVQRKLSDELPVKALNVSSPSPVLERLQRQLGGEPTNKTERVNNGSNHGDNGGLLGALLGNYGSEEEEEELEEDFSRIDALIARLLEATQRGGPELAKKALNHFSTDPAFESILNRGSKGHARFKAALEVAPLPKGSFLAWFRKNESLADSNSEEIDDMTGAAAAPSSGLQAQESADLSGAETLIQEKIYTERVSKEGSTAAEVAGEAALVGSFYQKFPFPVPIYSSTRSHVGSTHYAAADRSTPPWILDRKEIESSGGKTATAVGGSIGAAGEIISFSSKSALQNCEAEKSLSVAEEAKKEERRKKVRMLLQRQQQAAEERRQGQAAAMQQAEKERNEHLAAISIHKRMFLDDD